jgi:hypothetical protein
MEKIELAITRDLGQIIGDPFLFARQNLKTLSRAFLYLLLPVLVVSSVISALGLKNMFGSSTGVESFSRGGSVMALLALSYISFIIASTLQQFYVFEFMVLYEKNNEVSVKDLWAGIKMDWKIYVATYLLLIPVIIVFALLGGLVIAAASGLGSSAQGFIIFVLYIFGMYTFIPLSNLLPLRLREKLSFFSSLVKCFQISAGSWWKTFIAMFIMFCIFYSFLIILLMPFSIIAFVTALHVQHGSGSDSDVYRNLFSGPLMTVYISLMGFSMLFVMTVFHVFIGINYFSLSEKYDNVHLREEISQIGQREESQSHKQEGDY